MLPGGLSVLGVFIVTDTDAKDTLTTLRQVKSTFYMMHISHLWLTMKNKSAARQE